MFGISVRKRMSEGNINGFIDNGVYITGKLSFDGVVRIDGRFSGEINASGTLVVGADAKIEAKINVDTAIISGEIKGNIEAVTRVELIAPGKVYGNIKTPNLIIGEGTIFEGRSEMGGGVVTHLPIDRGKEAS